jgi:RNA-directed DNA polymerase
VGRVSLRRDKDNDSGTEGHVGRRCGATTGTVAAWCMVNGPEDVTEDWASIDWRRAEEDVQRLRQRIFAATQAGDMKRVRSLQKLMLRSRANALVSVRRVTEVNAGRRTAGVDGRIVLLASVKADMAEWVQQCRSWTPWPVKRVYIPKKRGKRPLGIPIIADRALQALVVNALEPEWEARFEPKSYGFRPGRGCHDAIAAIFTVAKGAAPRRRWVLDADLASAFDRISHPHLLRQLDGFPARALIRGWLRAGTVEAGRFTPTREGTPQGGVISPLLLNVALHGMEQAAGVRYQTGKHTNKVHTDSPILIRYADDLVALCHTPDQAARVKERLAEWLTPRGLAFNEAKTRITTLDEGFDFLGFNVRRYGHKLLIKPSKEAMKRIRERLSTEMRTLRGGNAEAVRQRLNPIIRGWSAYYRIVVSSRAFAALDLHIWRLTYKWAKYRHPNKGKRWICARYYGRFNKSRQDKWVFGNRDSGAYLLKFSWTKIVRHRMVAGTASPDDPALACYWTARRRRKAPPADRTSLRLLTAQRWRCPVCQELLLHADHEPQSPEDWEQWFRATRKAVEKKSIAVNPGPKSSDKPIVLRLVHNSCQRRLQITRASKGSSSHQHAIGLA